MNQTFTKRHELTNRNGRVKFKIIMKKEQTVKLGNEEITVETWTSTTFDAPLFSTEKTSVDGVRKWPTSYEVARNTPWLGRGSVSVRGISREITPEEAFKIAGKLHPCYVKS